MQLENGSYSANGVDGLIYSEDSLYKIMENIENNNTCEWKLIDGGNPIWNIQITWDVYMTTSCGKKHYPHNLNRDNPFDFCPYCGKKIINNGKIHKGNKK